MNTQRSTKRAKQKHKHMKHLDRQEYFSQLQDRTDSLFTSIFLYACESWTLTAETETFVVVVFSAVFCLFVCFFGHQALNGAVF